MAYILIVEDEAGINDLDKKNLQLVEKKIKTEKDKSGNMILHSDEVLTFTEVK